MGYSNSSLVDCKVLSPNHSGKRTHDIDRITPHCVVGQLSAKRIGDCFPSGRGASCNYGVGYDGQQCLIVEEKNRSWCTSSESNDQRAVTIEVASDKSAPYAFTNEAYDGLVELCVDICKRNGKKKLLWLGSKEKTLNYKPAKDEMVLTVHRWFKNKSCPGDWMYSRMSKLAADVNKHLIAKELVTVIADKIHKKPNDGSKLYRVQCGAFSKKENAAKLLNEIEAKGIDAFIVKAGGLHKVQVGAYGVKENAENQLAKMKKLGFDCFITTVSRESESFVPRKSIEAIAKEVIAGKWGNGAEREKKLKAAGYDYDAVQKEVNKLV